MTDFFGVLWTIVSLAVTFGGFPHQIWKNHKLKSVGMGKPLIFSAMASYMSGTLYGLSREDMYIVAMQSPALVMVLLVAIQLVLYRKPKLKDC